MRVLRVLFHAERVAGWCGVGLGQRDLFTLPEMTLPEFCRTFPRAKLHIWHYSGQTYFVGVQDQGAKYPMARIRTRLENDGTLVVQSVEIVSDQRGSEAIRQAALKAGIQLEEDTSTKIIQKIADLPY